MLGAPWCPHCPVSPLLVLPHVAPIIVGHVTPVPAPVGPQLEVSVHDVTLQLRGVSEPFITMRALVSLLRVV